VVLDTIALPPREHIRMLALFDKLTNAEENIRKTSTFVYNAVKPV